MKMAATAKQPEPTRMPFLVNFNSARNVGFAVFNLFIFIVFTVYCFYDGNSSLLLRFQLIFIVFMLAFMC